MKRLDIKTVNDIKAIVISSASDNLLAYINSYLELKYSRVAQILPGVFIFKSNENVFEVLDAIEEDLGDAKAICLTIDADIVSTDNNPL
jgi:DNA polymerase III delta subunit